jgi:hypothetical protein
MTMQPESLSNPPQAMPCVDCDGTLHLLTLLDHDLPPEPGTVLAYRCDSCMERFDLVWEEPQA